MKPPEPPKGTNEHPKGHSESPKVPPESYKGNFASPKAF